VSSSLPHSVCPTHPPIYSYLPQFVLGAEFAGRISRSSPIPKGCPYKAGDAVFGSGQGAFGELVVASWKHLVPMPANMSFDQAAGAFLSTHLNLLEGGMDKDRRELTSSR
jgi:NADPH:quinone reductase-like Zn-dependent oxidoreductase